MKNIIENKIAVFLTELVQTRFFQSLNDAIEPILSISYIGGVFLLLGKLFPEIETAYLFTLGFISIYANIFMAYYLDDKKRINYIVLSLISFLLFCFKVEDFGARGFILSIILPYFTYYYYSFLSDKLNGLKNNEKYSTVTGAIGEFLLNLIFVGTFVLIRLVFGNSIINLIEVLFGCLMIGIDNVIFIFLFVLIGRSLWYFGYHGSNIMTNIFTPLLFTAFLYNSEAYNNGLPLSYIVTIVFIYTWTIFGILPMVLALMLVKKEKEVVKNALIPASLNLGEPLIFGLPIVGNNKIIVPYLTCFVINGLVPYVLTKLDIISRAFTIWPYRIPAIIRIFTSSLDFRSVILYAVLMVINVVIYVPWFRKLDD